MKKLKIAFDLDGTLIQSSYKFPVEKNINPTICRIFNIELLRKGIVDLVNELKNRNCEVWVYTSSFRSIEQIKFMFWIHGINLNGIVNQSIHDRQKKKWPIQLQHIIKYPPAFGIDLLIEDSVAVKQEGDKWKFNVLIIDSKDTSWNKNVIQEINKLELNG